MEEGKDRGEERNLLWNAAVAAFIAGSENSCEFQVVGIYDEITVHAIILAIASHYGVDVEYDRKRGVITITRLQ